MTSDLTHSPAQPRRPATRLEEFARQQPTLHAGRPRRRRTTVSEDRARSPRGIRAVPARRNVARPLPNGIEKGTIQLDRVSGVNPEF